MVWWGWRVCQVRHKRLKQSRAEETTAQFRRHKDKEEETRTNTTTVCESARVHFFCYKENFNLISPHFLFFTRAEGDQFLETRMNENQQLEVHYMDSGYSYPVSEGFMDFFGGVSAAPFHYLNMGPMHDQESAYWSMHMNSYKYGLSSSESTSYYGLYEDADHAPRMDFSRRAWEYPSMTTTEDPIAVDIPTEQSMVSSMHSIPEERSPHHEDAVGTQVLWQDDIDPDTMTYEELLDLGEAVGNQTRGLSQELINLLPTSKHKSGGIFSRRKSGDRCVICQMRYKRGDRQINLPCKHAYHTECGSKWLSINKTCPVCNTEVFGDESRH